jgi:hypothetical protein
MSRGHEPSPQPANIGQSESRADRDNARRFRLAPLEVSAPSGMRSPKPAYENEDMTDLPARIMHACARIVAVTGRVGRAPRLKLSEASDKANKFDKIAEKTASNARAHAIPRRPSIIPRALIPGEPDSSPEVPQGKPLDRSQFDIAGFCSELDAMRTAMIPHLEDSEDGTGHWQHEPSDSNAANLHLSTRSLIPTSSLEDDVANAVRLLEGNSILVRS